VRARRHRHHAGGQRPLEALRGRHAIEEGADEALARRSHEDRLPERAERVEALQQREVVVDRLAEPDSGVDAEGFGRYTGALRGGHRGPQLVADLREEVVVARVGLHRAGGALHVHDREPGSVLGAEPRHPRGRRRAL
jgi:hypothetical protein